MNFFNCNTFVEEALILLCFNRGYNK